MVIIPHKEMNMSDETTSAILPETQAAVDILEMMESRAQLCGDDLLCKELSILHKSLERAAIATGTAYPSIGGAK